jgi:hypothetical protein
MLKFVYAQRPSFKSAVASLSKTVTAIRSCGSPYCLLKIEMLSEILLQLPESVTDFDVACEASAD